MRSPNVTDEQLLAFAAGELRGSARNEIEGWVRSHPDAARTVGLYHRARDRTANDDSLAPPPETAARAKRIMAAGTRGPALQAGASWPERFVATMARLVFDSRLEPVAVRDLAGGGGRFQLCYETARGEIDLQARRLEPEGGTEPLRWRLMGQYGGDGPVSGLQVAVFRPGQRRPVVTTAGDEGGLFTVEVEAGRYEIRLRTGTEELSLPDLEIG